MRSDSIHGKPPALPAFPPPPGTPGLPGKQEIESFLKVLKARVDADHAGGPVLSGKVESADASQATALPSELRSAREANINESADRERARLRKATQDFEAVFLHHMLREMRRTVLDSGLPGGGATQGLYRDMLDQALADRLADRGGLGLGDMLYKQLSQEASAVIGPEEDS